ncbi:PhzF family phenazine biosynthesis isomerase [Pseudomonas sp. PCH446]
MSAGQMTAIARAYGHESGFAFTPQDQASHDYHFRFFVPLHEMSMCGHATIGTVWLLQQLGKLNRRQLSIQTQSGTVTAHIQGNPGDDAFIEISQPTGVVSRVDDAEIRARIIEAIGLQPDDLLDLPFLNVATSRVKTLVPVKTPALLDAAHPDSPRIKDLCEQIDSTGSTCSVHVRTSPGSSTAGNSPRPRATPKTPPPALPPRPWRSACWSTA